jgi:arylsulfatase A-like enzyme
VKSTRFLQALFALFCLTSSVSPSVAAEKPNILLIVADDLGWKDVGYNDGAFKTPNIDALAKAGVVFTQGYAAAANCQPSRASLMRGQYTARHGVYAVDSTKRGPVHEMRLEPVPNKSGLGPTAPTIAKAIRSAGYETALFGKWHLGGPDGATPIQQGFSVFRDASMSRKGPPTGILTGDADPKAMYTTNADVTTWVTERKDTPWFAAVMYHGIHTPLEARTTTLERLQKTGLAGQKLKYAACLAELDDAVGSLIKQIRALPRGRETVVIFTSDNGATQQSPQEPLRGNKGAYYEGGIRVPLIIEWPGHTKTGATCYSPVTLVDIFPTLCEIAGATVNTAWNLDGISLVAALDGADINLERAIFWHFPGYLDTPVLRGRDPIFRTRPVTVMRKGDYKLFVYHEEWLLDGGVSNVPGNRAVELYYMKSDAGERQELSAAEPSIRDALLSEVLAFWKANGNPLPTLKKVGN